MNSEEVIEVTSKWKKDKRIIIHYHCGFKMFYIGAQTRYRSKTQTRVIHQTRNIKTAKSYLDDSLPVNRENQLKFQQLMFMLM